MEFLEQLTPFLSSVGFPVVGCIILWKYISQTLDSFRAAITTQNKLLERICDKIDLDILERRNDG